MSGQEVAWRLWSAVRNESDTLLARIRRGPRPLKVVCDRQGAPSRSGNAARIVCADARSSTSTFPGQREWNQRLARKADSIVDRRLSFFDLHDCHLGEPIRWNRDHKHNIASPMKPAAGIDYRDFETTGDCKYVWEPNRHHHLVVLGRAYLMSGDVRYARALVDQLTDWIGQNPFGMGMNWRSPLELAVRLINWVWAIDLIRDSGLLEGRFRDCLFNSVYQHIWEVVRKFSRGSSANNHLVGEAAGVFIASRYFGQFRNARRWQERGRDILLREIKAQTYLDGGSREQAIGYHLFVLQFFLLAGLVGRQVGEDLPRSYWSAVEKMFEFLGAIGEGGDALPMFGDADEGYVLDLGGERGDFREWMAVGAVLFKRADFKARARRYSETAWWLLGRDGREGWDSIDCPNVAALGSRAFPDSGYYLLQCGRRDATDRISAVFDCGDLGFKSIAAHAHADALSFTLRAFGKDVLVDPGTYDYFTYPRWRDYFRGTRAHNTVMIDDVDQSEMLGSFMWGKRAKARLIAWRPGEWGGEVVGEHDGYARLKDPVIHRRTLVLDGRSRRLTVRDHVFALGEHRLAVYFHLAEDCAVAPMGGNRYAVDVGSGRITIGLDPRLSVEMLSGSEAPTGGWVSRGYHRKAASTTLIGRCASSGHVSLLCRIEISDGNADAASREDGGHG